MKTKLAYIVVVLQLALPCYSQPYAKLPSATVLKKDIRVLGAKQILWDRLWVNQDIFVALVANVERASPDWLEIAQSLYAASDAGASEMLTYAFVKALPRGPANVLRSASRTRPGRAIDVETVCSAGVYHEDEDTTQEKWKAAAMRAVTQLNASDLRHARQDCLASLAAIKP